MFVFFPVVAQQKRHSFYQLIHFFSMMMMTYTLNLNKTITFVHVCVLACMHVLKKSNSNFLHSQQTQEYTVRAGGEVEQHLTHAHTHEFTSTFMVCLSFLSSDYTR